MIALVLLFFASGLKIVASDERAVVLRLGKIRPVGPNRTLTSGPHWVWPYPIEEIVRLPSVEKKISLDIDSFWYSIYPREMVTGETGRIGKTLKPEDDGYCLVRTDIQDTQAHESTGSDYNIVHSKWRLIYQIRNPELFFRNVYVEDVEPGEDYFEVITQSITPLMKNLTEDAVVATMVHYTIDEALTSKSSIAVDVRKYLQQKLDDIESGIDVSLVELSVTTWPRQVNNAFEFTMQAQQERKQKISEAKGSARELLNKAGGSDRNGLPLAETILDALKNNTDKDEQEKLWEQLAGEAREIIADAIAYRTRVISEAKANADYLKSILPEYQKHPELVIQTIYQDTIEEIFDNVEEKLIVQPTKGARGNEIRISINRDPEIARPNQKQE
ncbi:MAG: protease modulator HflK [Planctomycetota bacterium]|jgi:regulator of protease activity HflC (stomatin/prohibitin superfamily)